MLLFDRVVNDHFCGRMIVYASEWNVIGSWSYGESSGRSSLEKFMRSMSCGYELILCDYTMSMFMLWIGNVEG